MIFDWLAGMFSSDLAIDLGLWGRYHDKLHVHFLDGQEIHQKRPKIGYDRFLPL